MLKVLILAAQNNVSDARMRYLIRDRLSWLGFLGFDLGAATPDANTASDVWADTAYRSQAKMGPFIRTIGIKRAKAKIMLANLAYNMSRRIFHERRAVIG